MSAAEIGRILATLKTAPVCALRQAKRRLVFEQLYEARAPMFACGITENGPNRKRYGWKTAQAPIKRAVHHLGGTWQSDAPGAGPPRSCGKASSTSHSSPFMKKRAGVRLHPGVAHGLPLVVGGRLGLGGDEVFRRAELAFPPFPP